MNAAAAEWLIATDRIGAPYIAAQGGAIGRRGRVHIDTDADQIWVGGRADVIITETAHL